MTDHKTIAVAMSGGVDSSTVAAMLRAEGHNLIGLTMQLWNQRRLAGRAGMPEAVTVIPTARGTGGRASSAISFVRRLGPLLMGL